MKNRKAKAVMLFGAFISYIAMILINGMANLLPINNTTTGDVAARYENLFTPAGMTFSIWGVIYIFLGGFVIYQLYSFYHKRHGSSLRSISIFFFIISCVLNLSWILAWHYDLILISMIIMLLLLSCIASMYAFISAGIDSRPLFDTVWINMPVSIYLGWISIATIANAAVLLTKIGYDGYPLTPVIWTVVLIGAAFILAVFLLFSRKDIYFSLVAAWAFAGIALKRWDNGSFSPDVVGYAATAAAVLLLVLVVLQMARKKVY